MVIRFSGRGNTGKQPDSFKHQVELWRNEYAHAASLRERHPELDALVIDCKFIDPSNFGTYSPRTQSFYPAAKAFFGFACPRLLCLNGGFRLDEIVRQLIASKKLEASGVLECTGHLHPQDAQPTPCGLRLQYKVDAQLNADVPG